MAERGRRLQVVGEEKPLGKVVLQSLIADGCSPFCSGDLRKPGRWNDIGSTPGSACLEILAKADFGVVSLIVRR